MATSVGRGLAMSVGLMPFAGLGFVREPVAALADAFRELWSSTDLRREVLELLDELADRKRRPTERLGDPSVSRPCDLFA